MKFFARALDLKDDPKQIEEYLEYHKNVWPEVLENIKATGIRTMRIFVCGTRLFMYCETSDDFDPNKDYSKEQSNPRAAEWEELMKKYQQKVPAAKPEEGGWWTEMALCFDLEEHLGREKKQ